MEVILDGAALVKLSSQIVHITHETLTDVYIRWVCFPFSSFSLTCQIIFVLGSVEWWDLQDTNSFCNLSLTPRCSAGFYWLQLHQYGVPYILLKILVDGIEHNGEPGQFSSYLGNHGDSCRIFPFVYDSLFNVRPTPSSALNF